MDQIKTYCLLLGSYVTELPGHKFIPLQILGEVNSEQLENKTIILDDAGAYKQLREKEDDLFRLGRHKFIQKIYLAHYAKDVLPVVRENCVKLYTTVNNPDNFFDLVVNTSSINDISGIITKWNIVIRWTLVLKTITQEHKKSQNLAISINLFTIPETKTNGVLKAVRCESYFFTGEGYLKLKAFLEMSDPTIGFTPENVAYFDVE